MTATSKTAYHNDPQERVHHMKALNTNSDEMPPFQKGAINAPFSDAAKLADSVRLHVVPDAPEGVKYTYTMSVFEVTAKNPEHQPIADVVAHRINQPEALARVKAELVE